MGTYSYTALVVGREFADMEDILGADLDTLIDDGELEVGSIYYDSDRSQNVVGYSIACDKYFEIDSVLLEDIEEAKSLFEKSYNIKPKVYCTLLIT